MNFLSKNNFDLLIRSHSYCEAGWRLNHNEMCCTVFSAPNYMNERCNFGAVIKFPASADEIMFWDIQRYIVTFGPHHYPIA
jgi:hypothetical protein